MQLVIVFYANEVNRRRYNVFDEWEFMWATSLCNSIEKKVSIEKKGTYNWIILEMCILLHSLTEYFEYRLTGTKNYNEWDHNDTKSTFISFSLFSWRIQSISRDPQVIHTWLNLIVSSKFQNAFANANAIKFVFLCNSRAIYEFCKIGLIFIRTL